MLLQYNTVENRNARKYFNFKMILQYGKVGYHNARKHFCFLTEKFESYLQLVTV